MLKHVTPLLLVAAVSACSSPLDRRQANGNEDYVDTEVAANLVIPDGLKKPVYSKEYEIPAIGAKANPALVGKSLDIRPPLQVLPMAEGTHVEESADNIKIVVESIDSKVNLKQEIFSVLEQFMANNAIPLIKNDFDSGIIETDWSETQEVVESNLWGADKVYLLRQRYLFTVDIRPHGRTGNVEISLVEHEENYDSKDQSIVLSGEDKRRYTVDMLNSAIAFMSVKREQAIRAARIEQSLGIDVGLVTPEEGQAYWLADADYQKVWDRLRIVLPELGFEIADMDTSKGLFFIAFNDNSGFWSSLWGDNKLSLKEGNYRLLLENADNPAQTKLLLRDAEDKPLSNETVSQIYQNFSSVMKEERKVR